MPRIVQLANFYAACSGGLRTAVDAIGLRYSRGGIDRVLVVPGAHDADGPWPWGRKIVVKSPLLPGSGGYRAITARRRVRALLEELRPDAVEVSDRTTLAWVGQWAAERGVPSVMVAHERIDAILEGRVPAAVPRAALGDRWNRRLAGRFGVVVCPSRFSLQEFARIGAANAVVVPLGVDLDKFTAGRGGGRPGVVQLVCVGRLSAEKRPVLAIETLRHLRREGVDAHLTMVGDGPLMAVAASAAAGLPVTFTGHVRDRRRVATLLGGADVALTPCPAETFGLAALEALACATPVVAAAGSGACETLDARCGRAVPPTPAAMAEAVAALASAGEEARRAARARAERYSWDATVDGFLAAHRRAGLVVDPGRSRAAAGRSR